MEDDESDEHGKESADSINNQEVTIDLSDGSSSGASEQADEETLEDIADDPAVRESQNFSESEFVGSGGGKMPTATLSSDSQTPVAVQESPASGDFKLGQGLEQSASSSIGDSGGRSQEKQFEERRERPERQYRADYQENMPAYEGSVSEEVASNRRKMEERGMTARTFDDLRRTQRTVGPGNPEVEEARRRGNNQDDLISEYTVTQLEKPDDSPRDIMKRERTYRVMRR